MGREKDVVVNYGNLYVGKTGIVCWGSSKIDLNDSKVREDEPTYRAEYR